MIQVMRMRLTGTFGLLSQEDAVSLFNGNTVARELVVGRETSRMSRLGRTAVRIDLLLDRQQMH